MLAEEYVLTHKRVPECWVNNQGENSNFTPRNRQPNIGNINPI